MMERARALNPPAFGALCLPVFASKSTRSVFCCSDTSLQRSRLWFEMAKNVGESTAYICRWDWSESSDDSFLDKSIKWTGEMF